MLITVAGPYRTLTGFLLSSNKIEAPEKISYLIGQFNIKYARKFCQLPLSLKSLRYLSYRHHPDSSRFYNGCFLLTTFRLI